MAIQEAGTQQKGTVLNEKMRDKIVMKIRILNPQRQSTGDAAPRWLGTRTKNSNKKTNQENNKMQQTFFIPFKLFTDLFIRNTLIHTKDYMTFCSP